MFRNTFISAALALLVAGGVGSAMPSLPINNWIADFASEDALARAEAVQSLVALGPQVVAPLVKALEDECG